jgi:hypothetical protein
MLLFSRPSFKSGLFVVRVMIEGLEQSWGLKPSDKNTVIDFGEAKSAVLLKYPVFFSEPV